MDKIYDLIIIGGGPAGAAAAVYAGRKKMDTLVIAETFGGQSLVSDSIENWIGEVSIPGFELAQKLEKHVRAQESVEVRPGEKVTGVKHEKCGIVVETDKGNKYGAHSLLVASGGRHRMINVPGEEKLRGRGVAYCSTCDAPFFRDKTVAVVGGGNSGLEAVIDLKAYAKKIYLLLNQDKVTGDAHSWEDVQKIGKFELITCTSIERILGDTHVTGVEYMDKDSGEKKTLIADGIFIEIGSMPNSDFLKGVVEMNKFGEIIVDRKTSCTSVPGIFAAGDVTDEMYKQNNIAVGDAIRAALSAYYYTMNIKKDRSKMSDCELTNLNK